jgi:hypothetical protein
MQTFTTILVVSLVLGVIQRLSARPAELSQDGASLILKPGWLYVGIGWVSLVLGLGIASVPIFVHIKQDDRWPIVGLVVLFAGLGGVIVNDSRGRVYLTDERIEAFSPWRGKFVARWSDIVSVKYSPANRWFVLKDRSGRTIRVSTMYVGASTFVDKLRAHTTRELNAEALDLFARTRR